MTKVHRQSPLRSALGGITVALALALAAPLIAQNTATEGEAIESARETLAQWVETKRITSKERRDLELAKEILSERIRLVQREIETLQQKIKDAEGSISEADKKREELIAENTALKDATVALQARLTTLESGLARMIARIPDPIRERIRPLTQRLPQDDAARAKLSLSERFQNIVGVLNEVEKFNSEITMTSEVRQLPDGKSAEVTALYLGISQGYYVGMNGTVAGIGTATAEGWKWTPANDAAPAVAQAVAILKNEQVAAFVRIPVTID